MLALWGLKKSSFIFSCIICGMGCVGANWPDEADPSLEVSRTMGGRTEEPQKSQSRNCCSHVCISFWLPQHSSVL